MQSGTPGRIAPNSAFQPGTADANYMLLSGLPGSTASMSIPTEPIGSIPRPLELIQAIDDWAPTDPQLESLFDEAVRDTIERFEATGSPVITDGEQRKYHNFWTYSVHGLSNTEPDGFQIPFPAGHVRRMPRLTGPPFRYQRRADEYLETALRYASVPVKQAVISPSALSLMYPAAADRRLSARGVHLRTCCGSTRRRFATACKEAHTRSRSTSPRAGWP